MKLKARPAIAIGAAVCLLGAPAVVLRPSSSSGAEIAAAQAACGPELFSKAEKKRLNFSLRRAYLAEEERIGLLDSQWKQAGRPALERARLAHQLRRDARLVARRKMRSAAQVKALCERDAQVYGDPNGPTFEWAVQHAMRELHAQAPTDEAYELVVRGSQRSSALATAATELGGVYERAWNGFKDDD